MCIRDRDHAVKEIDITSDYDLRYFVQLQLSLLKKIDKEDG